jgi:hypothetical protein
VSALFVAGRKGGTLMATNNASDRNGRRDPKQLMKEMGSQDGLYGPLPPDDWLYRMRHGGDAEEQAMGWLHAHTIDLDHWSAWAADKQGQALSAKHLAADKGWSVDFAEHVLLRLEKKGRLGRDVPWTEPTTGRKGRGRIWLCASVPLAHAANESRDECENSSRKRSFVQNPFLEKPYVMQQLDKLEPVVREECIAWANKFYDFRLALLAAAMTTARDMLDAFHVAGFATFGVKIKQQARQRRAVELAAKLVSVELNEIPDFVQNPFAESYTKSENGSV